MAPYALTTMFGLHLARATGIASVICSLAIIAVTSRVYCRLFLTKAFWLDDWFLLLTLALFIADCAIYLVQNRVDADSSGDMLELSRLELAFWAIYLTSQACLKFSLATFFLRIVQARWQRILIIITIVSYTLFTLPFFFVSLFRCNSYHLGAASYFLTTCAWWERAAIPLNVTHATINAVVDWIFALTPIALVVKTKMSASKRAGVCAIIAFAALGSVVSVARIPYFADDHELGSGVFAKEEPVAIMSIVETGIGVICVSVAALRPLFRILKIQMKSMFGKMKKSPEETFASGWELGLKQVEEQATAVDGIRRPSRVRFSWAVYEQVDLDLTEKRMIERSAV